MNLKEALEVLFGENPERVRIVSGSNGFDGETLLPAIVGLKVDIISIDEIREAQFHVSVGRSTVGLGAALGVLFGDDPRSISVVSDSNGFDDEVLIPCIVGLEADSISIDEIRDATFEVIENE